MQNALKEDLNEPVKIVQAHTFNLRTICIIVKALGNYRNCIGE